MLHARPKGFLSSDYVIEEEGRAVAALDLSVWRERGTLELDEGTFSLSREGLLRGVFTLEGQGRTVARATKPSVLRSTFELRVGGERYHLGRRSIFGRAFDLESRGRVIGSIRPTSFLSRSADVDLPRDWSLATRLFAVWLVLVMWRRDRSAS